MRKEKSELKNYLFKNFYRNPRVVRIVDVAEKCIKGLFNTFVHDPQKMPTHFYQRSQQSGEHAERIVCDYLAGMTDRYAFNEYERLKLE